MLLFIDNFDSFTYNLVQCFQILGIKTWVIRNQALTVEECLRHSPHYVVIGPGPGSPSGAGISKDLILACAGRIPVLGVCLGHQALAEIYGGKVIRAERPMHGKVSSIIHSGQGIFQGLPQPFLATRYHSLVVAKDFFPSCLEVTARTQEDEIMGIRHRSYLLEGVQFHPESILTEYGLPILKNFLDIHYSQRYIRRG